MPNRLLDCLRRAALLQEGGGLSDGQLLELFVQKRDGDAFAALLKRHGPMVMGVCRRLLRNHQDAEDAFQAAFLIFARKAASVKAHDSVAGWLCRVAYRTALEARVRIARRRGKEQQVNDVPHPAIEPEEGQRELLAVLDKELDRLPEKYRLPVVLCFLEGISRKEAARTLGLAEGTLSWRLAQAKKLLAKRLSRHGLAISGGTLAAVLAPEAASAFLRASTVKAVLSAGTVPAQVLALTEGVMKAMLLTKLKISVCVVALALVAGVGATGLTYRVVAQEPKQGGYIAFSTRSVAGPSAADELEALRLEIEALRKSLQATRERVKVLEGEVSALKQKGGGPPGGGIPRPRGKGPQPLDIAPPPEGAGPQPLYSAPPPTSAVPQPSVEQRTPSTGTPPPSEIHQPLGGAPQQAGIAPSSAGVGTPPAGGVPSSAAGAGMMQMMQGQMRQAQRAQRADPVSEAEAALNKLRSNPSDKKALQALERALKRLKEPKKPSEGNRRTS